MLITEQLINWRIILASKSPRRQQLLHELGLRFEVITKDVSEEFPATLKREEVVLYLAKKKSDAFLDDLKSNTLLITADTIVCLDEIILNKPENFHDACFMLETLSGKKHEVITGVCLKTSQKEICFFEKTDVYFKKLTTEEITYYVKLYQPFDKAGAYGVQEWIGLIGLERIDGSYHNVMGLPVQLLYKNLGLFINSR